MKTTQSGYFLIADITGYTAYLSASELEHAQATLTDLLELLIEHTRPPLIISRLAGDAVISYALQDQFMQGQTFIEMIEDTYVSFRKAIERMVLNNTCQCAACANVSALDLKFFVHYGEFGLQNLKDHDELVGSDVIVIHRLLKNHVTEQTGCRAYTLYTQAALEHLGLQEMCDSLTPHSESYEHLGQVKTWVQDMHPVWEAKRAAKRLSIPDDKVMMRLETDIAMPPHQLWDYLVQPEYRRLLVGSDSQRVINKQKGRIEKGSGFQCFHGKQTIWQTVLEWVPFEQLMTEDLVMPNLTVLIEYRLTPTETGTHLIETFSKARGPLRVRLLGNVMLSRMAGEKREQFANFQERIEADAAQHAAPLSPAAPIPAAAILEAASASLAAPA
jgi:Protein of unknown function (DUF2652)